MIIFPECTYKINYNGNEFCIINGGFDKKESKAACSNLGYNLIDINGKIWEGISKNMCLLNENFM